MHMLDWDTYRPQVLAGVGDLAKLTPDTVNAGAALVYSTRTMGAFAAVTER